MNELTFDALRRVEYPVKIEFDPVEKIFTAEYIDLPGCSADGDTVEEAYKLATEAKNEWLRLTLEQGLKVPSPSRSLDHSGRILLRLPTSLHAALADKAHIYQSSLNTYVTQLLAGALVGDTVGHQLEEIRNRLFSCDTALHPTEPAPEATDA